MPLFHRPASTCQPAASAPWAARSDRQRPDGWLMMPHKSGVPRRRDVDSATRHAAGGGSNLGMLESLAQTDPSAGAWASQSLGPAEALELGPRIDGGATFASVLLLVLLVAMGGNRILGLERFWVRFAQWAVEQKRYADRNAAIEARQRLERQFQEGGGGGSREGSDGSGGGAGSGGGSAK